MSARKKRKPEIETPGKPGADPRFLVLAAASGALSLGYEVLWTRWLSLHLGQDVTAIVAVSSGFLAGLAIGTRLWERACRGRSFLSGYCRVEIAIGLGALLFPAVLRLATPFLHGQIDAGATAAGFSILGALVAMVPAIPMGATLPLLLAARGGDRGIGGLYAANCAGAATGAIAVTFVIIPALGHLATSAVLAAGNFALAILARGLPSGAPEGVAAHEAVVIKLTYTCWIAGLAGAASMASQLVWTRALIPMIGGSTFGHAMILAAFTGALAFGSWASRYLGRPGARGPVGFCLAGMATASFWGPFVAGLLPLLAIKTFGGREMLDPMRLAACLLLAALGAGPVAFLSGALVPLLLRGEPSPRSAANVLAVNTAGAIIGQVIAIMLLPGLQIHGTFRAIGAGCLLVLFITRGYGPITPWFPLALVAGAASFLVRSGSPELQHSAPYMYSGEYLDAAREERRSVNEVIRGQGRILYERTGAFAMIAVREREGGHRSLLVNGKPDASSSLDMEAQRLMAHLPFVFHPEAKEVLVIGYGSGITAGSLLAHPVERLTIGEISPEVVTAGPYFRAHNRAPLEDPRSHLEILDARSLLARSSATYDLVSSEPTNPWIAGVASLFTREFFQLVRNRLRPGGVAVQWVQGYSIRREDFQSMVATFRDVFPQAWLFRGFQGADYLLVGTTTARVPQRADLDAIFSRPLVKEDLADVDIFDGLDIAAHLLAGPADLDAFCQGAELQSDDRLALEFTAPGSLGKAINIAIEAPPDQPLPGLAFLTGEPKEARDGLESRAWRYRAFGHLHAGRTDPFFEAMATSMMCADAAGKGHGHLRSLHLAILHRYQEMGELARAEETLRGFLEKDPASPLYRTELAALLVRAKRLPEAISLFEEVLASDPDNVAALRGLASLEELGSQPEKALERYRHLTRIRPHDGSHEISAARVLMALGRPEEAAVHLAKAREKDPAITLGLEDLRPEVTQRVGR